MYPRDNRGAMARLLSESTALLEIGSSLALRRKLVRLVPGGDGHPVMLIPGFTASDRAMGGLRRFLRDCGYAPRGWGQGRNIGVNKACLDAVCRRVADLESEHGAPVSLLGWSGGGMYARAAAAVMPESVRAVITMGTPFKMTREHLDYMPQGILQLHERLSPEDENAPEEFDSDLFCDSPPVPSTSLYSERDALAPWPFCLDFADARSENVHVPGSHAGMTFNPLMYYVIADRLAQDPQTWQPFTLNALRRLALRHGSALDFYYEPAV